MSKARAIPAAVPGAPMSVNASLPVMVRLEELAAYHGHVHDPRNVEEIHEMRIAVKRLRYTLEMFVPVIEDAGAYLKTLKRFQQLLGDIHDADVLAPLLEEGSDAEAVSPERAAVVQVLLEHARTRRGLLYDEFIGEWDSAVAAGFLLQIWNAAMAASMPADGPAGPRLDAYRLLPPKRMRRIQKTVALLRLAPYAAAVAPPDRVQRLTRAVELVHDTMFGPDVDDVDDKAWWKSVRRLGRLISYDEA